MVPWRRERLEQQAEGSVFAIVLQDIEDGCLVLAVSSLAACGWRTHSLQQDGALAERGLCMERGPPLPHLLGCVGSRWRRSPPGSTAPYPARECRSWPLCGFQEQAGATRWPRHGRMAGRLVWRGSSRRLRRFPPSCRAAARASPPLRRPRFCEPVPCRRAPRPSIP